MNMDNKHNYSELLKDPRWQRRKAEILTRDNFVCQNCGCKDKTLHVHHKYYDGRNPWDYEDEALTTLCEDCHSQIHKKLTPQVGKLYRYYHSDYWNDMLCYHIDFKNKIVYLFGVDCGCYGKGYIESFSFDYFKDFTDSNIIPENDTDEYEDYQLNSLSSAYVNLMDGNVYVSANRVYDNEYIINFAQRDVTDILKSNEFLISIFDKYNEEGI